jgi:hypothetical protein
MTVFHNRRTAAYEELTGNSGDYMFVPIPGQSNADAQMHAHLLNEFGYSGGQIPGASPVKYPLDQTTAVVNMR